MRLFGATGRRHGTDWCKEHTRHLSLSSPIRRGKTTSTGAAERVVGYEAANFAVSVKTGAENAGFQAGARSRVLVLEQPAVDIVSGAQVVRLRPRVVRRFPWINRELHV